MHFLQEPTIGLYSQPHATCPHAIHCNINIPSMPASPKWSLLFTFSSQYFISTSHLSSMYQVRIAQWVQQQAGWLAFNSCQGHKIVIFTSVSKLFLGSISNEKWWLLSILSLGS
jgi:hypothetical protein